MEDHEIAAFLRDMCRRRMSGADIALCETIADGWHLTEEGKWITASDRQRFEHLKTQFAADLAHAGKAATR